MKEKIKKIAEDVFGSYIESSEEIDNGIALYFPGVNLEDIELFHQRAGLKHNQISFHPGDKVEVRILC